MSGENACDTPACGCSSMSFNKDHFFLICLLDPDWHETNEDKEINVLAERIFRISLERGWCLNFFQLRRKYF